jgi:hypothetical protein
MIKPARSPLKRASVGLIAVAVATAVAACGSSSSSSTTSAASGPGASVAGSGISGAQLQARVKLAECARAHGINIPDPGADGTYGGVVSIARLTSQYGQAKLTSVEQQCRQYLVAAFPVLAESPAQRAARRQQLFKFAACMRSHGVPSFPDPGSAATSVKGTVDPQSPAFKSALTACQTLLPARPGGGG